MHLQKTPIKGQGYEVYPGKSISPISVFLENRSETIAPYVNHLVSRGHTVIYTTKPGIAINACVRHGNWASYYFDMHMRNFKKVRSRETQSGLAVGLTVICEVTDDGTKDHINHCSTISYYEPDSSVKTTYRSLEKQGQRVVQLKKKKEDFDMFKDFATLYENDYVSNIRGKMVLDQFEALEVAFSELSKSNSAEQEIAAIMGYPGAEAKIWLATKSKIAEVSNVDINDRLDALVYIKEGLNENFGIKGISTQKEWVHVKREDLNGNSVWDILVSGELDGVYTAANYVNRVLG